MDKQAKAPVDVKKRYTSPEFKAYGSLAQVTATVGKTGATDGGGGSTKSTNF